MEERRGVHGGEEERVKEVRASIVSFFDLHLPALLEEEEDDDEDESDDNDYGGCDFIHPSVHSFNHSSVYSSFHLFIHWPIH